MQRKSEIIEKFIVVMNVIIISLIYISIELLGKFNAINGKNLKIVFGLCVLFMAAGIVYVSYTALKDKGKLCFRLEIQDWIFLVVFVLVCIMMGRMAYYTVPRNHDSMTYHLPRIMHWLQNHNLEYWFTSDIRELYSQPLAEMIGLLLYGVVGTDHLANMQQFYGYFFCTFISVLILKKYNVKKEYRYIAAVLIMTAPIVIAEGVTTQNDLFSAICPLIYLYFTLDLAGRTELSVSLADAFYAVVLGLTFGLSFLSKAQSVIPVIILSVWLLITRIRKRDNWTVIVMYPLVIGLVALLLVMPYLLRNYNYCGSILATEYFGDLSISGVDPRGILINLIKNWSMGAKTYSNFWLNQKIFNSVYAIASFLRFDVNHIKFALDGMDYGSYLEQGLASYDIDVASAPFVNWLFLIVVVATVIFVIIKRKTMLFTWNVGFKFALLCSIVVPMIYIRWQPWVTRLFVPVYMFMALFVVIILNDISLYIKENHSVSLDSVIKYALPIVLIYCAIPAFSFDSMWATWGRLSSNPFDSMIYSEEGKVLYSNIIDNVNDAEKIGLLLENNTLEYPLWVGIKDDNNELFHIDLSEENVDSIPDVIIKMDLGEDSIGDTMNYGSFIYECSYLASEDGLNSIWRITK